MPEGDPIIPVLSYGQNDFTVHQLTVFRSVAQHLSYTRAAEALYLSQPAVSQQIKTLEQVLSLRLFTRKGRGIALTPAGQELLRHAERLLTLLAETVPLVNEIHTLERGSVLIGASSSAGTYVVPALLGAFQVRFPQIHVTLEVANRKTIEERLLEHQIDLAVLNLIEQQNHFNVEFLLPYELVVVASPSHPLVGKPALRVLDLRQDTFLLREPGSGTRADTEEHFQEIGVPLHHSLELGSIEAIKEGVIARLGIAVLSRESVAFEVTCGDLVILDVEGFPVKRHWNVVHLRSRRMSLAATALRNFLLQKREDSAKEDGHFI